MNSRLLVAIPLYLTVPALWFCRWEAMDRQHVVGVMATRKQYLQAAMTNMFGGALERDDWDRVVVYEADMLPPVDAFTRIAHYPDSLDVVGSLYHQHPAPHHPVVYEQVTDNGFKPLHYTQIEPMVEKPGLYPADAVGFGFTSIHRRVLEKWDPAVPLFGGELELGHDLYFCREARKQGFAVHIDTAIECGHLTEVAITLDTARTYRHQLLSEDSHG